MLRVQGAAGDCLIGLPPVRVSPRVRIELDMCRRVAWTLVLRYTELRHPLPATSKRHFHYEVTTSRSRSRRTSVVQL